ncbi:MAG: bifunctional 4-hydroxy-2-oxoglutarate aldolase/2-dehydro-3-deoxy-phosphogluconate aldolase [Candidatus Hydrogenedentota bacterium]
MSYNLLTETLEQYRVVPVIAIEDADKALPLADALIGGGLPVAEITFRTEAAAEVIRTLRREKPDLVVGAGTVISLENAAAAVEAGAQFAVAPGLNPKIVAAARDRDMPFIPGIATPSDLERALELECFIQKFFPSEALGGTKLLKAMSGPYAHTGVRFVPTGGVNAGNLAEYLTTPGVIAVGGTWVATKQDIATDAWDTVAQRCREVADIVAQSGD